MFTKHEEEIISKIAEVAHYGLEWAHDEESQNSEYSRGAYETVAHQIACMICQWLNVETGIPTSETLDALDLTNTNLSIPQLKENLEEFISHL